MRIAAAICLLLPLPAFAGDNAPAIQWAIEPPEPEYRVWIEAEVIAPLWPRCDLRPCGDWYQRQPDPAPVPLPPSLLLLTAALAALIWKGSHRV